MKNQTQSKKDKLRLEITSQKKKYSKEDLRWMSDEVFSVLEITGQFRDAKHILIYNALPDEVDTIPFIEKWKAEKVFYFPKVVDNTLSFCKIAIDTVYQKSDLGVEEPMLDSYVTDFKKIDMVIVPGVAFDRTCNRLGRGKGHYDRFLSAHKNLFKVGVCFDFQLIDSIPSEEHDIKMDMLVSENDLIW